MKASTHWMAYRKIPETYSNYGHIFSKYFWKKKYSSFLDKWVSIIHQIMSNGSVLNWGEIMSLNLGS